MENFGTNTDAVRNLIEQASKLTGTEAETLATVWDDAWEAAALDAWRAWDAAWAAARDAAVGAALDDAWASARIAAGLAAGDAAGGDARPPAGDAAQAAVVHGLISDEQYQILAGPWESVMGPIFPSDTDTPAQH